MNLPIPESLPDFQRVFPDERACEEYLFALRWPNGYVCPACGCQKYYWHQARALTKCACCGKQTYLTAGTIMHGSKMELKIWFYAAFVASTLTPGISAVQFQKIMGLSRYETAFQMLHKIRHAMVNPERDKLHGLVEVDETYMGGVRVGGKGGRNVDEKTIVIGAVEVRASEKGNTYAGRVRFRVIPDASAENLILFIQDHIEQGSIVITDGWRGYFHLREFGYDHRVINESQEDKQGWLRLIHLEISNLKTGIRGTYHGRVEEQHLQAYVNEFAFRHNRRFFDVGAPFLRVLQYGMEGRAPTREEFYSAGEQGRSIHLSGLEMDDEG